MNDAAADRDGRGNELVLRCLRREPPERKIETLEKLTAADWQILVEAAVRYRLGPLVYATIKPWMAQLSVSDEVGKKLQNIYFQSAVRNVRLYGQILKCCSIFNREGLEVILLKGAHLAEFVYGNPALRPMSDVDILAQKKDLARIDSILKDMGYTSAQHSLGSSLRHMPPYKKKGHVTLEVHFNISSSPISDRYKPDDFWKRAGKKNFNGVDVMTLSLEDLFLNVCEHAGIHHVFENGLIPCLDIATIIENFQRDMDWPALLDRARLWGMDRCVFLMLALTEKKLGLTVPDEARMEMSKLDSEMKEALALAEKLIFEKRSSVSPGIARLFDKGWHSKLKNFRERAFPAQEYMGPAKSDIDAISRWDLLGRYRLRLAGVWQRHGKTLWAALKRDPQTLEAIHSRARRNALSDWLKKTA